MATPPCTVIGQSCASKGTGDNMPELDVIVRQLCTQYGFFQVLDAMIDAARMLAVDAARVEDARKIMRWRHVSKALEEVVRLYQ